MLPFNFQNYNTAVTGLNNGILYEIIKGKLATTSMSENGPLDHYEGWGPNYKTTVKHIVNGKVWTIVDARIISGQGEEHHNRYPLLHNYLMANACRILQNGNRCLIICDTGVSRGNSIALGVLVEHYGINFYDAWDLVKERVPDCQINPPHIEFLKRKFKVHEKFILISL
jgi:hypothetical protein